MRDIFEDYGYIIILTPRGNIRKYVCEEYMVSHFMSINKVTSIAKILSPIHYPIHLSIEVRDRLSNRFRRLIRWIHGSRITLLNYGDKNGLSKNLETVKGEISYYYYEREYYHGYKIRTNPNGVFRQLYKNGFQIDINKPQPI